MKMTKTLASTLKMLGTASALSASLLAALPALATNGGGVGNFFGNYLTAGELPDDPTKPPPSRSYFKTQTEATPNGAKLHVDIYTGKINDPITLWLLVAINDGKGNVEFVPLRQLSNKVADNTVNYHVRRTFDLDYNEMNAELKALLPPTAQHLSIGPGSPLFVAGHWIDYNHAWGGGGRGGIFFMPGQPSQASGTAKTRRPTDLDIGYEITGLMAARYNTNVPNTDPNRSPWSPQLVSVGLKEGGQIKSRLESEGKYQVPLADAVKVKTQLYALARDPNLAASVLGSDWTLTSEDRYMKRDASGQLIKDENGNPIPDPMVDTFYDNATFDAAKNDTVIRWRKTEGNGYGSWNFKPGTMMVSAEGIADRTESSVDATDETSSIIRKYADSSDPLNIFAPLFKLNKSSKPSDYLQKPVLTQPDDRHKFKLKHKTGLIVEVSFDEVQVESHIKGPEVVRYYQVEMDVEHPATQAANVATQQNGGANYGDPTLNLAFLGRLKADAFVDGRPVMHTVEDLHPQSPINVKLAADKALAAQAIIALRDNLFGKNNWIPGANKYALSSYVVKHVNDKKVSNSVKKMLKVARSLKQADGKAPRLFKIDRELTCRALFK